MPYYEKDYALLKQRHFLAHKNLGEPSKGISEESLNILKEGLEYLKHHDEFYTILDLRTLKYDWCFGLENALGYQEKGWTHYDFMCNIHDDFRNMFLAFGVAAYQVLQERSSVLKIPLASRYIINLPMMKKNGTYNWVKMMALPLNRDSNGNMVTQLTSYTIVSRFVDVFLPLAPRLFDQDGKRSRDLEKDIFQIFLKTKDLGITPFQMRILETYCELDEEKAQKDNGYRTGQQRVLVSHKDVAEKLGRSEFMVKKNSSEIHAKMKDHYKVMFPNTYQIALFFKPLFYK